MTVDASRSCLGLGTCVGANIRQIVVARVLLTVTAPPALPGSSVSDGLLAPPLRAITSFSRSRRFHLFGGSWSWCGCDRCLRPRGRARIRGSGRRKIRCLAPRRIRRALAEPVPARRNDPILIAEPQPHPLPAELPAGRRNAVGVLATRPYSRTSPRRLLSATATTIPSL
jgi:hypothetical protein